MIQRQLKLGMDPDCPQMCAACGAVHDRDECHAYTHCRGRRTHECHRKVAPGILAGHGEVQQTEDPMSTAAVVTTPDIKSNHRFGRSSSVY